MNLYETQAVLWYFINFLILTFKYFLFYKWGNRPTGFRKIAQNYIVLNVNMEFEPRCGWLQRMFSFHLDCTANIKMLYNIFYVIRWKTTAFFFLFCFCALSIGKVIQDRGRGLNIALEHGILVKKYFLK